MCTLISEANGCDFGRILVVGSSKSLRLIVQFHEIPTKTQPLIKAQPIYASFQSIGGPLLIH